MTTKTNRTKRKRSITGLKPCPFCGGVDLTLLTFQKTKGNPEFRIMQCDSCGATGPIAEHNKPGESEQKVRLKWDMRAKKV